MKKPIEPLDPELRRLLDAEADFPVAEPALEARVWKRVQSTIVAAPPLADSAPPAAPGPVLTKYGPLALLAAFLAGGVGGAGIHHAVTRSSLEHLPAAPTAVALEPTPAPAPVEPAPTATASSSPPMPSAERAAPQPSVAAPPSAAPSAKALASSPTNLARERAIIEVARTAVSRGRTSAALDAIERHAREFPKGQLVEEREGLRVLALARSGQSEDARKKAAAFRKRYPNSVLLPATEAATDEKTSE